MKKLFAALTLGAMLIVPLVAVAASSSSERLPAAVDQMLARDMIQQAQLQLKVAGYDPGRADGIFDAQTSQRSVNSRRRMVFQCRVSSMSRPVA